MPHAYTEDQLVEQPAGRGKAKGSMLKAEMLPPEAIDAAIDELTRDLLSGQVGLATAGETGHPAANL